MLAALLSGMAHAADWPEFLGPSRNGMVADNQWRRDWPDEGLPILWRANVGTGFSSLAVADGRLFTLGNANETDTVWCLESKSGKVLWKRSYPSEVWPYLYEGGPNATPTVHGDSVYTLGRHGEFFCFEAATGSIKWKVDLHRDLGLAKPRWGFSSPPLVEGGRLYLNAGAHGLALDAATGAVVWSSGKEPAAYARPVAVDLEGERALLIFGPQDLFAVKAADGALLWSYPWKTQHHVNTVEPLVSGNKVFVSSPYGFGGGVLEISRGGAKEVWKSKEMANHFATCVLLDGHLYGTHGNDAKDARLKCLDFQTGEVKWSREGFGLANLMVAGGRFILLSEKGELAWSEVSQAAFEPKGRSQILGGKCWTPPALVDGLLYARNARGDLVCVDLRRKPGSAPQ